MANSLETINEAPSKDIAAVIKDIDPDFKRLLGTASYVILFEYNLEKNVWERAATEGEFYVYNRKKDPLHCILILNRLSDKHLLEPITYSLALESHVFLFQQFFTYRNKENINCVIWFSERKQFVKISWLLETLFTEATENNGVDIHTLSTEACVSKRCKEIPEKPRSNEVGLHILKEDDTMPQSVKEFFYHVRLLEVDVHNFLIFESLKSNPIYFVDYIERNLLLAQLKIKLTGDFDSNENSRDDTNLQF